MTTNNGTPTATKTLEDVTLDQLVGLLEAIVIVRHQREMRDVPRYHQLNGCTFFLDRDGGLAIDERDGRRPLVKLTPDEVYGMLIFLRLPGVATLIERLEAQRQARCWADYETDTDEEAVRLAAAR